MRKPVKIVLRVVSVVVVLLVIGLVIAYFQIDQIAKGAIEKSATAALGEPTTVEKLHIGVFGGTATLDGLVVANPKGYEGAHFMRLEHGAMALTMGSVFSDTIEIPTVTLDGIEVNLHQTTSGGNYEVILANIKRSSTSADPSAPKPKGKGFIIKQLSLTKVKANVMAPMVGLVVVELPEIKLTNIGSDTDNGAQLEEVTNLIMRAVLTAIARKGGNLLPGPLLDGLNRGLEGLGSLKDIGFEVVGDMTKVVGDLGKTVGKLGENLLDPNKSIEDKAKGVGDTVKGIGDGIGGLLGGNKDKDKNKKE